MPEVVARTAAGHRRASRLRPLELDPGRVALERPHHAVVDIGSNSVRLVVYDELGRAPFPRFNEKSLCRLGEGLEETGRLGEASFARTVEACRRFRAICDAMEVARIDVLATEAVRSASNGQALIAAIAEAAGFEVRLLSGAEEARFAGLGVISGFYRPTGLVGDMGGGSLEVIEVLDDRVGERDVSLSMGALPVQAMLAADGRGARKRLDALFAERLPPALIAEPAFYAVGGGFRAIAKAHMAANGVPVRVVHGYALDAGEARSFAKRLWGLTPAELAAQPGVPARRLATIPAAALVLDRLLKRLEPERVVFSALGLREGWLYEQLSEAERYLDPLVEGAQIVGIRGCPGAGVRRRARALDRCAVPGRDPGRPAAAARRLRADRHRLAQPCRRPGRGKLPPAAAVPVHRHRPPRAGLPRRRRPRPLRRRRRRSRDRSRRWPCCLRRNAAARACSAARCGWRIASPAASARFSRPPRCRSRQALCASRSRAPRASLTARP